MLRAREIPHKFKQRVKKYQNFREGQRPFKFLKSHQISKRAKYKIQEEVSDSLAPQCGRPCFWRVQKGCALRVGCIWLLQLIVIERINTSLSVNWMIVKETNLISTLFDSDRLTSWHELIKRLQRIVDCHSVGKPVQTKQDWLRDLWQLVKHMDRISHSGDPRSNSSKIGNIQKLDILF